MAVFYWMEKMSARIDAWLTLRRVNRDVPRLHKLLSRAGYSREHRRRLMRDFVKGVQTSIEGVDIGRGAS